MTQRTTILWAASFGCLGVMIGAFGAHVFKESLEASGRADTFETAVAYQFYHTLTLLLTALLMNHVTSKRLHYAALFFVLGIFFFSGSLYVLCLTGVKTFGAITPIGGVLFIAGWLMLFATFIKK